MRIGRRPWYDSSSAECANPTWLAHVDHVNVSGHSPTLAVACRCNSPPPSLTRPRAWCEGLVSLATCDCTHGVVICQGPNLANMIQDHAGAVRRDDSVGLRCTLDLKLKPPNFRDEDCRPDLYV